MSTTDLDPQLFALAESQRGMFTTGQARMPFGLDHYALGRLTKAEVLTSVTRGLYAVTRLLEESPEARHRQLCTGALLLYPEGVLASTSAVVAHGLPVWDADLTQPTIRRDAKKGTGARGIRIRRKAATAVETDWGPAVPVARALIEHAIDHGSVQGVVSADAALHRGLCTVDELAAEALTVRFWPGSHRVTAMVSLVDGRAESPGESRTRCVLAAGGIELEPQVEIRDGAGYLVGRVDFLVRGTRTIIEFDGKVKYADGDSRTLFEEKRREDRLRALGYVVVRLTWADLERPGLAIAKVRRALRAA